MSMNMDKAKAKKQPKFGRHMKRTNLQFREAGLSPNLNSAHREGPQDGRMLLNEVTPVGFTFFAARPLMVGNEINVTVEHPTRFFSKARIVGCVEIPMSYGIVREEEFKYRVIVEFIPSGEEQKKELQNYFDLVQREVGRKVA